MAEFGKEQIEAAKRINEMAERSQKINESKNQPIILCCPCCGSKALHYDRFERHTIECSKCGLQTPIKNTYSDCLKIWNVR